MATILSEKRRFKVADRYVGDVRGGDSNGGPWVITAFKDAAVDPNNNSLYLFNHLTGERRYIGTTAAGKDGGGWPFVTDEGDVGFIYPESPAPNDSGSLADLWCVILNYNVGASPVPVDQIARNQVVALTSRVAGVETSNAGQNTRLDGLTARVAGLERADVLDGQRHTALVQQVAALNTAIAQLQTALSAAVVRIAALEARPAVPSQDQVARDGVNAINARLAKVKADL